MKKLIIFLMIMTINVCGMELSKNEIKTNDALIKEFRKNGDKINFDIVVKLLKEKANPNIKDTEQSDLKGEEKKNRGGMEPVA